ncbi:MAG: alginate lyase family protein [Gemmatimonas sp.]
MRTLLSKLQKLKGRSPHELYSRIAQRAYSLSERAALHFDARPDAPASIDARTFSRPFFAGIADVSRTVQALRTTLPGETADIVARAQRIEDGHIPLLGFGELHIGAEPDWQRDPFAGLTAPLRHWSTIPYLDPAVVGDHKVVWEISRHQYFVTLGQAWQISRDARWPTAFVRYLESWLDGNPPSVGMNWASSLEVSYRAISWLWAMQLMRDADAVSDALKSRVLTSLKAHGRHLERYLSTYFSPNTHLTGEALGLFYIGTQCPELPQAAAWCELGARILDESIDKQVLPDGVYFEQATQYHRYTIDIYLHYLLLARANNRAVPPAIVRALHRMFDVMLHVTRADGTFPLIGDDDGGRLVQLDARLPNDSRALLATGAVLLERYDLAWMGRGDDAALVWMLGAGAAAARDALVTTPPADTARTFVDGGIFVMRDGWAPTDGHAVIDCGPHGALSFGHSHADALAVDLSVGGRPLFVDAGTFTYVGPDRDAFRVTAAHNTIEIDGISTSTPGSAFRWKSVAHPTLASWTREPEFTCFAGQHDAYAGLPSPLIHRRTVLHPTAGLWIVGDDLSSAGQHDATLRWRGAAGLRVQPDLASSGMRTAVISDADGERAVLAMVGGRSGSLTVEQGWVSSQLGHKEPTSICVWRERAVGNARLASIVIDSSRYRVSAESTARFRQQVQGELGLVALHRPVEDRRTLTLVIVGGDGIMQFAGLELQAALTCLEVDKVSGRPVSLVSVGLTAASYHGSTLAPPTRAAAQWLVASELDRDDIQAWQCRAGVMSRGDASAAPLSTRSSRGSAHVPSTV